MPLDAATQAFLTAMRAAGGKPLYEQTVEQVRAGIKAASQQLAPPATEVHEAADRRIPGPGGSEIAIRVYTPRPLREGDALPIVLQYHGGGFVAGDLDTHDGIARYSADTSTQSSSRSITGSRRSIPSRRPLTMRMPRWRGRPTTRASWAAMPRA